MGLLKWIFAPLDDMHKPRLTEIVTVDPTMPEYPHDAPQGYRPTTFDHYIGQSRAKSILQVYIKATQERHRVMPHILIHGRAGCGKTTLAHIVANELGLPFAELTTSTTAKNSWQIINRINEVDGGVLFLDELHSIERNTAEMLYSIMEDFTYNGQPIKPFTLIGATTELGELIKDRRPFVDRFKVRIELEDYTLGDLARVARQYRNMVFPNDEVDPTVYDILAANCRHTPRLLISMMELCVYSKSDTDSVLDSYGILYEGFTRRDMKVLQYLAHNTKGVGLQGLVSYLGTSADNYQHDIEPYLLHNGLLVRTPRGRKITVYGETILKKLESM
jgi:Holliday junction DNA helicase RuvB